MIRLFLPQAEGAAQGDPDRRDDRDEQTDGHSGFYLGAHRVIAIIVGHQGERVDGDHESTQPAVQQRHHRHHRVEPKAQADGDQRHRQLIGEGVSDGHEQQEQPSHQCDGQGQDIGVDLAHVEARHGLRQEGRRTR